MVDGIKKLRRQLEKSIPDAVRKDAAAMLEKIAGEVVALMKSRAPEEFGDLRRSINWTWGDAPEGSMILGKVGGRSYATMRITIYAGDRATMVSNSRGVEFQNAILQEFGTANMPPTPYFYPSWRQKRRGAKSRTTRAIKKAITNGAR